MGTCQRRTDHHQTHMAPDTTTVDLKTNTRVPPELIRRLEESEKRLNLLEAQISSAETALDVLHRQRDEEIIRLSKLRNATAPHSKLPPEMLAEIFEHYVSDPIVIRSKNTPGAVSPLVLSQICSTWRAVAMGTPTLWNKVLIKCDDWQDAKQLIDRAHKFLERSGSSLLTLYSSGPGSHPYIQSQPLPLSFEAGSKLIRNFIEPYTSRLESLKLSFPSSWLQHFLSISAGDEWFFPHLQSVDMVYNSGEYGESSHKESIDFFVNAPLLSRFKLVAGNHSAYLRSTSYLLPWSQLIDLHLFRINVPMPALPALLSSCTSLSSCTLTVMKEYLAPDSLIAIPTLRSLTLHNPHNFDYNKYLESLAFPSLSHLSVLLYDGRNGTKWSHTQFTALLARSACTLASLHTTAHIEHPDIEAVLGDVPSLVELDVQRGQPVSASTLRFICNGLMAPSLEVIKCVVEPGMLDDFLDMLDCRHVPHKSQAVYRGIRKAVVRCDMQTGEYEEVVERLEELRACGRDVTVEDRWVG